MIEGPSHRVCRAEERESPLLWLLATADLPCLLGMTGTREREREREGGGGGEKERVCVCERENVYRERMCIERE